MKKIILNSRTHHPGHEWTDWRIVYLIKENQNTWHIWSILEPFGRFVHKQALGERIADL